MSNEAIYTLVPYKLESFVHIWANDIANIMKVILIYLCHLNCYRYALCS